MQLLEQIAETYAWAHAYGNRVEAEPLARYVCNKEHAEIWVANHISGVRARTGAEIDQVLQRSDQVHAHCRHRMAIIDALTPEAFVARLALLDYREMTPTIHMVLEGKRERPALVSDLALRPVVSEDDWRELHALVRIDHEEGKRTHHLALSEEITRGMVAGYRAKSAVQQFFFASQSGVTCAFGSAISAPYGMGIVEDLFTLPAYRKRGIASTIVHHSVSYARERGMERMLIGALASETAKSLYAALGFVPQCLTREYLLDDSLKV